MAESGTLLFDVPTNPYRAPKAIAAVSFEKSPLTLQFGANAGLSFDIGLPQLYLADCLGMQSQVFSQVAACTAFQTWHAHGLQFVIAGFL